MSQNADYRGLWRSTTCVVVTDTGSCFEPGIERCGAPVTGVRGGFPMCAEHMDVFGRFDQNDDPETGS